MNWPVSTSPMASGALVMSYAANHLTCACAGGLAASAASKVMPASRRPVGTKPRGGADGPRPRLGMTSDIHCSRLARLAEQIRGCFAAARRSGGAGGSRIRVLEIQLLETVVVDP